MNIQIYHLLDMALLKWLNMVVLVFVVHDLRSWAVAIVRSIVATTRVAVVRASIRWQLGTHNHHARCVRLDGW